MIHILVEENYSKNSRFISLLEGIGSYLRRRHDEYKVYKAPHELPPDCRVVAVICQSLAWSSDMVEKLNSMNIHPLIFGFQYLDTMYSYSSLSPNYTKSAYRVTRNIMGGESHKVAILGYNSDSLPDKFKLTGIKCAVNDLDGSYEVFTNDGDIIPCLEAFKAKSADFTKIVCCNDNVAITLLAKFADSISGKEMCSCTGERLSEFLENPYPVCRINYVKAGLKLASLYRFLAKEEEIPSTVMTFDMDFSAEENNEAVPQRNDTVKCCKIDFYGDAQIRDIELLNAMLLNADETDIAILSDLESGITYEDISSKRYIAVNTVKYRTKKMMEKAGVSSKRDLISKLREYGVSFR